MNKRGVLTWTSSVLCLVAVFLGAVTAGGTASESAGKAKVIKVVVQRFHYTPSEIRVRKGQPVVLEFTSVDFVHGFKVPALGLRTDLPPGKITKVTLRPEKAGVYDFLCDNFCGSGHEEMSGRIIVTD